MSEKVKLTREQAEAIERIKSDINEGFTKGNIRAQFEKRWNGAPYVSLNELTMEQYIAALLGVFEVEESFEVEDAVVLNSGKVVEILEEGWGPHAVVVGWIANGSMYRDMIDKSQIERHANKQEIWWASHGRKPLEFKANDVVSLNCLEWGGVYVVYSAEYSKDAFGNRLVRVFNKRVRNGDVLSFKASELNVICFAEGRKDV